MAQARKLHDQYFKKAKEEGYAARSAYKLKQIQDKRGILKRGDWVLDLGCSPGSWVQVASEIVGDRGRVGGIDLKPVEIEGGTPGNAKTLVADIFKSDGAFLLGILVSEGKPVRLVDVVLSDMAPNTEGGGGGSMDHFRSVDLCRRVLELCPSLLRPGGNLVMKVFEGEVYPELLKDCGKMFADVKGYKPEASREVSREMFITAKGYRGGPLPTTPLSHGIAKAPPAPMPGWGGGGA